MGTQADTQCWLPFSEIPEHKDEAGVLTARLIDTLAVLEPATDAAIADALCLSVEVASSELQALEDLGVVRRTGEGPGTSWWLG